MSKMLGIAIAAFFAGLVLWALAANATPLSSATHATKLKEHSDKLADQHCETKCHWSYFWNREVCETDCYDYKLQQHDQQLAQTDEQEQDAERAEWKRKRELWLNRSRARMCTTNCTTDYRGDQHCVTNCIGD